MDRPTTVRAAVVQAAPVAFDLEATLARVESLVARAASEGAEIAVFPEAFVGGYPKGADFGARVGSRRAWARSPGQAGCCS
jgi:nitrilase